MTDRLTPVELQATREYLGLTIEALAAILGVRADTARRWETGRDQIPVRVRAELADIQDTTDRAVASLADDAATTGELRAWRSDDEFREHMPQYARFTARWWRHVAARVASRKAVTIA